MSILYKANNEYERVSGAMKSDTDIISYIKDQITLSRVEDLGTAFPLTMDYDGFLVITTRRTVEEVGNDVFIYVNGTQMLRNRQDLANGESVTLTLSPLPVKKGDVITASCGGIITSIYGYFYKNKEYSEA